MAHKKLIKEVVRDLSELLGITPLMVLHDAPDILSWADIILVMQDGKLVQQGTPEEIYHRPVNEYCAGLFGMYNLVNPFIFRNILKSTPPAGKKLFIRPEDILVTNSSEPHVKAIIRDIQYWGSYHTLEISVGGELINMQVNKKGFVKGSTIAIEYFPESIWYI
jgi:iron(III) transport system ATP-binding protein